MILDKHRQEWSDSAINPEIIEANLESVEGQAALERLLSFALEQVGGHGQQYATAPVKKLLDKYQHIEAGGWWVSGVDPQNNWEIAQWGQLKPDTPRPNPEKPGKFIKYETPPKTDARAVFLKGYDWAQALSDPNRPIMLTEGIKKAGCALSQGYAAIALQGVCSGYRVERNQDGEPTGVRYLIPDISLFATPGRPIYLAFDQDENPQTRRKVATALERLKTLLEGEGGQIHIVEWSQAQGKGLDDLVANHGPQALHDAVLRSQRPQSDTELIDQVDIQDLRNQMQRRRDCQNFSVRDVLPVELANAIENDAHVMNTMPVGFLAYILSISASLLPRDCHLSTPQGDRQAHPILWLALIGTSGSGKTRARTTCTKWLAELQKEENLSFKRDHAAWKEDKENHDDPPIERKYMFGSATPEAVVKKMAIQQRHGSVWVRDELKALFSSLDQYHSRGGDGLDTLIMLWDRMINPVDRVKAEDSYVADENNLSIVGGIQPGIFERVFDAASSEQGLAARMLFVQVPALPSHRVIGSLQLPDLLPKIYSQLLNFPVERVELSQEADELLTLIVELENEMRGSNPAINSWVRKSTTHTLRVALVLHAIKWAMSRQGQPDVCTLETLEQAYSFVQHCYLSFSSIVELHQSGDELKDIAKRVLSKAAAAGTDGAKLRDIYNDRTIANVARAQGLTSTELVKQICEKLSNEGLGRFSKKGKSIRFIALEWELDG